MAVAVASSGVFRLQTLSLQSPYMVSFFCRRGRCSRLIWCLSFADMTAAVASSVVFPLQTWSLLSPHPVSRRRAPSISWSWITSTTFAASRRYYSTPSKVYYCGLLVWTTKHTWYELVLTPSHGVALGIGL